MDKRTRYGVVAFVVACLVSILFAINLHSRAEIPKLHVKSANTSGRIVGINPKREVTHIGFLKVHKAGSSTLQNIFYRFGIDRNLTFVLPRYRHYISETTTNTHPLIPPPRGGHYDILCNHAMFNSTIFSRLLPPDAVFLAVVREPFEQFVSAAYFYRDVIEFKYLTTIPDDFIQNLVLFPEKYENNGRLLTYTRNSMARDFGFQPSHVTDNNQAERHLRHIDHVFDLVLVSEYMDESLVLMRRLLNWTIADILYVPVNVGGHDRTVDQSVMAAFRERNALDYLLYEHFHQKFWKQLYKAGEDIFAEVVHFKRILKQVKNWCQHKDTFSQKSDFIIKKSQWNPEIGISRAAIESMQREELEFHDFIKRRQAAAASAS